MQNASLAELEQHAVALRARLLSIAEDITALLAEDLPRFAEREMKRAFVGAPEFAATISDAKLRQLKAAVTEKAAAATREIITALGDESIWTDAAIPEDPRASIAANARLWAEVNRMAAVAQDVATSFGFPKSEEPIEYKPPTWFIGRRYLPTLSEKYWSLHRDLAETTAQAATVRSETSRTELSDRWDKV
ncbi:MAG: hypothetical protein ACI9OJ_000529 [Myxococcota bacterium]|jgi:hypothetical protein